MRKLCLPIAIALLAVPLKAKAADEGLYDPLPPKNSVFIRFINAAEGEQKISINNRERGSVKHGEITPYYYSRAGKNSVSAGAAKSAFESRAGEFRTVVIDAPGLTVLKDESFDNNAKCQLIFYNLGSDAPAGLSTADGKIEIVAPLARNAAQSRLINPVSVAIAVYANGQKLADGGVQPLDRGNSYSAVFLGGADGLLFVKNMTNNGN